MSNRYKGAVISATPPTTTGGEEGTASGAWTLEQQMQLQAAGLWPAQPTGPYIEQVFQTWLYTGNVTPLNITNGIDLAGKGGLIWTKERNNTASHLLIDSQRGLANGFLESNTTDAADTSRVSESISSFNANGYTLHAPDTLWDRGSYNYVSWTFRKQPKFFDVVTYTGNGTSQNIAHNLGSVPGCIIVKQTSNPSNWMVYHASLANTEALFLNLTNAKATGSSAWNSTTPTSTVFSVGANSNVNASGESYVAYIYAHNAGGFGLTGTDNVISCGSYAGNSGTQEISLGYEPQWMLVKTATAVDNWWIVDNMRGLPVGGNDALLNPNSSSAEINNAISIAEPTATGFIPGYPNSSGETYIYIAIRRGPMRVPTSGTSVFSPVTRTGTGTAATITGIGFAPDLLNNQRTTAGSFTGIFDRLRGAGRLLYRALADAETTVTGQTEQFNTTMDGFAVGTSTASDSGNNNTVPYVWQCFKRAPSFFDIVCYTGTGSATTVTHNLGVAPELMIVKVRSTTNDWAVYSSAIANTEFLLLDTTSAKQTNVNFWNSTSPTSSVFTVGTRGEVNASGQTFVSYLFATCAGVSKVGSYTGTGAAQTINCGFTGGSRFVLIKRTDSTGDWYVWDSARGIIPSNDPYLLWNTSGAEVTGTDYVDTTNVGFDITSTAPAAINASGGTFIFLAIA